MGNYPDFIFGDSLLEAEFVERPNRFIVMARLNGELVRSHLPDPGRLKELLTPGAKIFLRKEVAAQRKTQFSTQAVEFAGERISINSWVANSIVAHFLKESGIEFHGTRYRDFKAEYKVANHRFDFLLKSNHQDCLLEVKSVSLLDGNCAKFPDAVSARASAHLKVLTEHSIAGGKSAILFAVKHSKAKKLCPAKDRDPKFAVALNEAIHAGVQARAMIIQMLENRFVFGGFIPVEI